MGHQATPHPLYSQRVREGLGDDGNGHEIMSKEEVTSGGGARPPIIKGNLNKYDPLTYGPHQNLTLKLDLAKTNIDTTQTHSNTTTQHCEEVKPMMERRKSVSRMKEKFEKLSKVTTMNLETGGIFV